MKPNIENIDKCIAIMKRIPEEKFNIGTFQSFQSYNDPYILSEEEVMNSCGTTCCFSGWIRVSPEFKHLQDPQWENLPEFVTRAASIEDDCFAAKSIADLLGISSALADFIIYDNDGLYVDLGYRVKYEETKPKHIIAILEDIKNNPEKFIEFEEEE